MKNGQAVWKKNHNGTIKLASVVTINENDVLVETTKGEAECWNRGEAHKVRDPQMAAAIGHLTGIVKADASSFVMKPVVDDPEPENDGQPTELQENEDFAHDDDASNQEPNGDGTWS